MKGGGGVVGFLSFAAGFASGKKETGFACSWRLLVLAGIVCFDRWRMKVLCFGCIVLFDRLGFTCLAEMAFFSCSSHCGRHYYLNNNSRILSLSRKKEGEKRGKTNEANFDLMIVRVGNFCGELD